MGENGDSVGWFLILVLTELICSTANMKLITSIYMNCRPDLRDEWLTGNEADDAAEAQVIHSSCVLSHWLISSSQAQELALRQLVKFCKAIHSCSALLQILNTLYLADNVKRYGPIAPPNQIGPPHRRTTSMSHLEGLHPGMENMLRPLGTPNVVDADVFPPSRSQAADPSIFLPYVTEDIAFEEEYEEYLSDLGWSDEQSTDGPLFGGISAWNRLPPFAADNADGISDSESIASIGELGDDARLDLREDGDVVNENLNNWEVSPFVFKV